MDFSEQMISFFHKHQNEILNVKDQNYIHNYIKAIDYKINLKYAGTIDVLISYNESYFLVKLIKVNNVHHLLPLDFSESVVFKYREGAENFRKSNPGLYEKMIEEDFDFTLNNPHYICEIGFAIMTSLRFMENISATLNSVGTNEGRNKPCPCKSGLKYKKCCGKYNHG